MTEEEATNRLIELTKKYMDHSPEERKELYNEYQENRKKVKEALINSVFERKQNELNNKIIR